MDERDDFLRELCNETDGFITTDQLAQLIDDPTMQKTALATLDPNNTGRIPFEKFQKLLAVNDEVQNSSDLQRSSSSSDDHDQTFQEYDYDKTTDEDSARILSDESPTVRRRPIELVDDKRRKTQKATRFRRQKSGATDIEDLSEQISMMRDQIAQIEERELLKSKQLESTRLDNMKLTNRIHELEELLNDAEHDRDMFKDQAESTTQDYIGKMERENRLSLELLTNQVQQYAADNDRLQAELEKMKLKSEKYKSDLNNQSYKLDEYQQRAVVQIEKYQILTERAAAEREDLQNQNRISQQSLHQHKIVIEELEEQNKELQSRINLKNQDNFDVAKDNGHLEMQSLQVENQCLSDQIEDLNLQLLNQHVSRARALSDQRTMDTSLADEFFEATKDQLEEKYKKLSQNHQDLRDYLENILENIMERDPTLLEIRAA